MLRAVVLFLAFTATATAEEFSLTASRSGDAVEIAATAPLNAAPDVAWRVLTDYERYADFIPGMEASRVISREGDRLVVEQRGSARWLWLSRPVIVRLAVTETPRSVVMSKLLSGTIRDVQGRYELVRDSERLRLVYTGRIVPDETRVGYFDLLAVRANASRQFGALVEEIERAGRVDGRGEERGR